MIVGPVWEDACPLAGVKHEVRVVRSSASLRIARHRLGCVYGSGLVGLQTVTETVLLP